MLAIRLPQTIEDRLDVLAGETGRTKTALAREAILEHIDDLEDFYLAEADWKYRVGDWRVICEVQDKRIVVRVLRVGNRREVYR